MWQDPVFMCRNIRVLHHFAPSTTEEEVRAAALQYVRKVTGIQKPSKSDEAAFARAVEEVAASTSKVLAALPVRATLPRTREGEQHRARLRWAKRATTTAT